METSTIHELKAAWSAFRENNPRVRIRDAAAALGVSEAELLATDCGDSVTRLKPAWYDLLPAFEGLGEVMALTRNDLFVHEKVGHYEKISVFENHKMGQTLGKAIDLRIFFRNWHYGFAVVQETEQGVKRSLQFFDAYGTAVHKIHLRDTSNVSHFDALVAEHRDENQDAELGVLPRPDPNAEKPDSEVDQVAFREAWDALQDTHDFIFMLRKFGVNRLQAFRLAGTAYVRSVPVSSLRTALEAASDIELPIMIFVNNPGCVQIHTGPVKRLQEARGWYNILDPGFNLHVKDTEIDSAWIVRKPTKDGDVHSLEFFDADGQVLCYLFGERKEGRQEREAWRDILDALVTA